MNQSFNEKNKKMTLFSESGEMGRFILGMIDIFQKWYKEWLYQKNLFHRVALKIKIIVKKYNFEVFLSIFVHKTEPFNFGQKLEQAQGVVLSKKAS